MQPARRRPWIVPLSLALALFLVLPAAQAQVRTKGKPERAITPRKPPTPSGPGSIQSNEVECVDPEIPDTPDLRSADGGQRPLQRASVWPLRLTKDRTQLSFVTDGGSPDSLTTQTTTMEAKAAQHAQDQIAPDIGTSCKAKALFSFHEDGYVLPGMPDVAFPDVSCGDSAECVDAMRAWVRGHYHLWIAQMMINLVASKDHSEKRAWLWGRPGVNAQGNPITEESSFEYWFGPYSEKRFRAVKDGLDELWDVTRAARSGGYDIELRCPDAYGAGNVCNTVKPGAHHIVRGNVDLCAAFFGDRPDWDQARIMNHEMLHHLWVDWGDAWVAVQDKHYHGHGDLCIGSPDSSAAYGESKIRHLATYLNGYGKNCGHLARNVRNNDTYAYFITWVGTLVYNGTMTKWPHPAEPTPHPPKCVGDENCLCDDKETWPGSDPFEPDGDYSPTQWCWDGDGEMTCRATKFGATTEGICKRCDDVRGPGCECDNAHPCDVGSCYGDDTFNGGTGHCFKDPPPPWACLADCSRLLNDDNAWCYADYPTGEAHCMDYLCDKPTAFNCNLDGGKVCRYDECVIECADDADCAEKGYPPIFHCNQGRCEHGL